MAKHKDNDEPLWMRRAKSEGAVPMRSIENCSNGWTTPPGSKFMVRGPNYFSTRTKIPAGDYLLKPLAFDWIKSSSKISNILKDPNSRVRKVIEKEFPAGHKPYIWAFNLQLPSKENFSAIAYFASLEPFPEGSLIDRFVKGDDGFRTSRLKLIANIDNGPWVVRKAVGEQAICVVGRALSCEYLLGENFLEVDIDIGSSVVATTIVHVAFGYVTSLTVDLAFLIESQTESELPEKILGAFRFSELQPISAQSFEALSVTDSSAQSFEALSVTDSSVASTPRLGLRLWKSLRQGLSQLMNSTSRETSSVSGSSHKNGTTDHDDNIEEGN